MNANAEKLKCPSFFKWAATALLIFHLLFSLVGLEANGQDTAGDIWVTDVQLTNNKLLPHEDTVDLSFHLHYTAPFSWSSVDCRILFSEDSIYEEGDLFYGYFPMNKPSDTGHKVFTKLMPYFKPGLRYIIISLDYRNIVEESNEFNNTIVIPIQVEAPKEVDLYNLFDDNFEALAGDTISLGYFGLFRKGYIQPDSIRINYYFSNDTVFNPLEDTFLTHNRPAPVFHDSLVRDGRSAQIILSPSIALGRYYIIGVIDPENTIKESNENNNVFIKPFTVIKPSVDLSLYEPGSGPDQGGHGPRANYSVKDSLVINYHAVNNHGNSISKPFTVAYFLSEDIVYDENDLFWDTLNYGALPAHGFTRERFRLKKYPDTTTRNFNYILYFVDYYNTNPDDINKKNNFAASLCNFPLYPRPDLAIASTPTDGRITIDSIFDYSVIVKNEGGTIGINRGWSVRIDVYTLDGKWVDEFYPDISIPKPIETNELKDFKYKITLPYEGVFVLKTKIDPIERLAETTKTNNEMEEKIIYYKWITSSEEKAENAGLRVYPNPAQETFSIYPNTANLNIATKYTLYNPLGKAERSQTINSSAEPVVFDCQGLTKGIYILKAESEGTLKQTKIILQ